MCWKLTQIIEIQMLTNTAENATFIWIHVKNVKKNKANFLLLHKTSYKKNYLKYCILPENIIQSMIIYITNFSHMFILDKFIDCVHA